MSKEFLWVEKYRPRLIGTTVLNQNLKDTFQKIVDTGEIPNMMFTGTAGTGKTTIARAICDELNIDYISRGPKCNLPPCFDGLPNQTRALSLSRLRKGNIEYNQFIYPYHLEGKHRTNIQLNSFLLCDLGVRFGASFHVQ